MTAILRFLIEHMAFLYAPGRFRFADSTTSESFGGDAELILESDTLALAFSSDRGQLMLAVRGVEARGDQDWFSIDVVYWLVKGGKRPTSALLTPEYAEFLEEHLDEIERRFSEENLQETTAALRELERRRA